MGIAFRHSGRLGDIVYSLAVVKSYCHIHKVKADFYIMNDCAMDVRYEQNHPGKGVRVSQALFDTIAPLLAQQTYIESVRYVSAQQLPKPFIELDLSDIDLSCGVIPAYYRPLFSIPVALESAWLELNDTLTDDVNESQVESNDFDIVINKSSRHYNERINYQFLKQFKQVGFIGLEAEFKDFKYRHGLDHLIYIKTNNAVEMLNVMKKAKLFIGNQSFIFSLAEAAKIPRALDMYKPLPNVLPIGGVCVDFYNTAQLIQFINWHFSTHLDVLPDLKGGDVSDIWAPFRAKFRSNLINAIKSLVKKLRIIGGKVLKVVGL